MTAVSGDMEWNIDMEVNLFHAMRGHKPAGVNRHFQMIAIHDKLSSSTKKVTSSDIWKHLSTLYDLQALYESEIVPFPNKNGEFTLPDKDLLELCTKSFPRSSYINSAPSEPAKPEATGKTISKLSTKQESKIGSQTPKSESKSEQKSSSSSKSDNRSSTPSSRTESKSSHHSSSSGSGNTSSKSIHQNTSTSIPSPSPKRTKRTRNVNSASASPATPTEPQSKRRR